jgi:hypothetical protein
MAVLDVPNPLVTAPSRPIWERFSDQDYLVFVDESFFHFFDFAHADGNFCHGAFGIPASEYAAFKAQFAPTVTEYVSAAKAALGRESNEIKHADLYKLPLSFRRRFALHLNGAVLAHGGFITGFHTSNRGFVMEKLREDLVYEQAAIPQDYDALFRAKIVELNTEHNGPGKSDLISRLLNTPIAGITNFLNAFRCHFRMIYDPRHPDEDEAVKAQAEDYMKLLSKPEVQEMMSLSSGGTGLDTSLRSEEEVGLQLADIVAGEVRRFFRFNNELLTFGSSLTLVSGESEDELECGIPMNGILVKSGRFLRTPMQMQKKYFAARCSCHTFGTQSCLVRSPALQISVRSES